MKECRKLEYLGNGRYILKSDEHKTQIDRRHKFHHRRVHISLDSGPLGFW